VPLIFGGKVYSSLERVMSVKLILVLGYLLFVTIAFASWDTWIEIFSGFFKFGMLPQGEVNWARLAAFTAIAGAGGLTNSTFSGYARDKGWGMGAQTGAIASAVGGRTIKLSHTGKVFDINPETLTRWQSWLGVIKRDQFLLWLPGCCLGMALPAMFSYEFLHGNVANVEGNAVAAMTANAIAGRHGPIFWFLTLICGFLIMAPTQVTQLDQIARRWTDVLWIGSRRLHRVEANKSSRVYYTLLSIYCVWGLIALRVAPDPLILAIATGVMWNFAYAFTSLHLLWVMLKLMPQPLRPGPLQCAGLLAGAVLYAGISAIALAQQWPAIRAFFGF
ncbi:MAG TPA: Nramp family divalent metal transporter, partial [Bryobacteraceae bacterium]|nr:Nramp family divalent metal transporter [Bryobacteraceae bacterium]